MYKTRGISHGDPHIASVLFYHKKVFTLRTNAYLR